MKLRHPILLLSTLLFPGCSSDCTTGSEAYQVRVVPENIRPDILLGDTLFFTAYLFPAEINSRAPLKRRGLTMTFTFKIEEFVRIRQLRGATDAFDIVFRGDSLLLDRDSTHMTIHIPEHNPANEAPFGLIAKRNGRFAFNMYSETTYSIGQSASCLSVLRLYSSLLGVDSIGAHHFAHDSIPYYPGWQFGIEVMP